VSERSIRLRAYRHTVLHRRVLRGARRAVRRETGPRNAFLARLVVDSGAQRVLETGVAEGYSTAYLLEGLRATGGRLTSVDQTTPWTAQLYRRPGRDIQEVGCVVPREARSRWRLVREAVQSALPRVAAEERFDLVLLDDDHSPEHVRWEMETIWRAVRAGGIVVVDDVDRAPTFFAFCSERDLRWRTFPQTPTRAWTEKPGGA
jgi:predicted O-methyltransferase YrrM